LIVRIRQCGLERTESARDTGVPGVVATIASTGEKGISPDGSVDVSVDFVSVELGGEIPIAYKVFGGKSRPLVVNVRIVRAIGFSG
jgi:hypothetical protein